MTQSVINNNNCNYVIISVINVHVTAHQYMKSTATHCSRRCCDGTAKVAVLTFPFWGPTGPPQHTNCGVHHTHVCSCLRLHRAVLEVLLQPLNGLFFRITWVSRYQKGKTNLDFSGARDSEWQWHQLGHMQVCTSLQTDNHASTPPLCFLQARCPSCRPTNSVIALKAQVLEVIPT